MPRMQSASQLLKQLLAGSQEKDEWGSEVNGAMLIYGNDYLSHSFPNTSLSATSETGDD